MRKTNFHTHTRYCDGANTCREMVEAAIEMGFDAIGFSGHAYTDFDDSYCMSLENTANYVRDITELKEEYKDKINVYCGLEMDYFSNAPDFTPDYTIGSLHYFLVDGKFYHNDSGKQMFIDAVNEAYGGDYYLMAEDYFGLVSGIAEKTNCDIIGHFDLITKFNEGYNLFDEKHPRYIKAWQRALDKLLLTGKPFEINTGAISRGHRTMPYPSEDMLKYIKEKGGKVIITTDCHNKKHLDCAWDKAVELIEKTGVEFVEPETLIRR